MDDSRARLLTEGEAAALGDTEVPAAFGKDMERVRKALGRVLEGGYLLEHQAATFRVMATELDALENMAKAAPQDLFKAAA